ncbi:MAG: adenosylmethionine decarboxylase [Bacteroidales bacterium]|nr:adenosylmethionine decarboxylase [Bacteroidales bacterium]
MPPSSPKQPVTMAIPTVGIEWVIEATDCDTERLRDLSTLRALCDQIITDSELTVLGEPHWHRFPGAGGVTGLYLLAESHLACHTYPEHRFATFNLYCCRPREPWPWQSQLREQLAASTVHIRQLTRGLSHNPEEGS